MYAHDVKTNSSQVLYSDITDLIKGLAEGKKDELTDNQFPVVESESGVPRLLVDVDQNVVPR